MKLTTMIAAGALALSSTAAMAQSGTGGANAPRAGAMGNPAGNSANGISGPQTTGSTAGAGNNGTITGPGGVATNPSGNSLINSSPSGSTLSPAGQGSTLNR